MDNLNDFEMYEAADELEFLLDSSAAHIIHTQNPELFIRWFRESAGAIAPTFIGQLPDDVNMPAVHFCTTWRG